MALGMDTAVGHTPAIVIFTRRMTGRMQLLSGWDDRQDDSHRSRRQVKAQEPEGRRSSSSMAEAAAKPKVPVTKLAAP
jgi:acetyl-CoA carboxylase alpha subunit